MDKKIILVTGAAGFIGYHICSSLIKQGHHVIGLDNITDYYDVNLKYDRNNKHKLWGSVSVHPFKS